MRRAVIGGMEMTQTELMRSGLARVCVGRQHLQRLLQQLLYRQVDQAYTCNPCQPLVSFGEEKYQYVLPDDIRGRPFALASMEQVRRVYNAC